VSYVLNINLYSFVQVQYHSDHALQSAEGCDRDLIGIGLSLIRYGLENQCGLGIIIGRQRWRPNSQLMARPHSGEWRQ